MHQHTRDPVDDDNNTSSNNNDKHFMQQKKTGYVYGIAEAKFEYKKHPRIDIIPMHAQHIQQNKQYRYVANQEHTINSVTSNNQIESHGALFF